MGVAIATYTTHEKAPAFLPARRADQYARFFRITPEYLLYGRGDVPDRVAVLDSMGQDTGRTAALPPQPSELTQALEGDGLAHYGLVAIYNQPQDPQPSADCHGRLCVVAIQIDNLHHRLLKTVQPGSAPGRFHLISPGGALFDHEVLWMAPVLALVPG
jgi:hypothetical protein